MTPTEYCIPNTIETGAVVAVTKAVPRAWPLRLLGFKTRRKTVFLTVMSSGGGLYNLSDGSTLLLGLTPKRAVIEAGEIVTEPLIPNP